MWGGAEIERLEWDMKAKTIKLVLRKKINAWFESIEDEEFKRLAKKNTIVTGGCIASMLLKEKINDFDIYFRDHATALAAANYYVGQFKDNPPPAFADGKKVPIHVQDEDGRVKIVVKSAGIAGEQGDGGDFAV